MSSKNRVVLKPGDLVSYKGSKKYCSLACTKICKIDPSFPLNVFIKHPDSNKRNKWIEVSINSLKLLPLTKLDSLAWTITEEICYEDN